MTHNRLDAVSEEVCCIGGVLVAGVVPLASVIGCALRSRKLCVGQQ